MVGDQAEQGRHEGSADIGAGHLDADEGLGLIRAEMLRCGMDDAGINGGTAKAHQ